ncbi:COX15/CtaA family protein [Gordonia paraffinivorans]|uniref:Cytochrome oxidase assembly protein n=2 Tax=Gordonia paraffinivorans TaxID=175628 RepID=A0ABQ0IIG7_9ACTN|nr:COX15/CtaA family protein [Gordonia paraffinivorans]MBY4574776.1 heme A synthase [Gordonia paraffinivorans]MCD2144418.1 COX15/CtaA family protein [Gordonia paraffinivorans]PWD45033.1 heme A synthase [Gordonia paraffinivorans]VFA82041.1 Cytochrome oxidase assembly protein [Gordonia paraffinivorans]GAC83274.1 putative cytochrome oxidase assembly protein [Gordonia paraffinivorans NBRC 108238]
MTTSQTSARPGGADPGAHDGGEAPGFWQRIPGFGRPTARFVHRWAIALLISNVGIVATGGAVRVTASGLGCPTWPRCTDESFVPHGELGIHGAIEFGNRLLTWVLIVIAIAAWVAVLRYANSTRSDKWLVTLIALGIPLQGVIGGITVLTDLNPWVVALHFLLSMILVSAATVLVYRMRPYPTPSEPAAEAEIPAAAIRRLGVYLAWLIYLVTWVTIYLGTVVTGSGPHAGDADVPRNGLDPDNATQLHADAVFVLVGLGIAALVYARVFARPQQRSAIVFALLILLQGLIGFVQFFTGLPIALVIAHMFGSALLLIGATWQVLVATETDRSRVDA